MASRRDVTNKDIEDGLYIVATLIKRFGNAYWPIYDRLEKELHTRKSRASKLSKTLKENSSQCVLNPSPLRLKKLATGRTTHPGLVAQKQCRRKNPKTRRTPKS